MDLEWLAPGKYNCSMVIYSVNKYGTQQVHDRIEIACTFEKVLDTDEINRMTWNSTWWGHMMLPEIKILK